MSAYIKCHRIILISWPPFLLFLVSFFFALPFIIPLRNLKFFGGMLWRWHWFFNSAYARWSKNSRFYPDLKRIVATKCIYFIFFLIFSIQFLLVERKDHSFENSYFVGKRAPAMETHRGRERKRDRAQESKRVPIKYRRVESTRVLRIICPDNKISER